MFTRTLIASLCLSLPPHCLLFPPSVPISLFLSLLSRSLSLSLSLSLLLLPLSASGQGLCSVTFDVSAGSLSCCVSLSLRSRGSPPLVFMRQVSQPRAICKQSSPAAAHAWRNSSASSVDLNSRREDDVETGWRHHVTGHHGDGCALRPPPSLPPWALS